LWLLFAGSAQPALPGAVAEVGASAETALPCAVDVDVAGVGAVVVVTRRRPAVAAAAPCRARAVLVRSPGRRGQAGHTPPLCAPGSSGEYFVKMTFELLGVRFSPVCRWAGNSRPNGTRGRLDPVCPRDGGPVCPGLPARAPSHDVARSRPPWHPATTGINRTVAAGAQECEARVRAHSVPRSGSFALSDASIVANRAFGPLGGGWQHGAISHQHPAN
jgi:hypothetical protein